MSEEQKDQASQDAASQAAEQKTDEAAAADQQGQLTAEQQAAEAEAKRQQEDQEKQEQAATEKKPWFQKRMDKLTRQRGDAERAVEAERRRADQLQSMLDRALQQPLATTTGADQPGKEDVFVPTRPMPTMDQFDHDTEKYVDALTDWKLEQRDARADAVRIGTERKQKQEENTRRRNEQLQTYEQKRTAAIEKGVAAYTDFNDVVNSMPMAVMNEEMATILVESEKAHEVAYYLGKNHKEAERISKLPAYRKAIEFGLIEARLANPVKPTTKAPPPPTPLKGKGSEKEDEIDPAKDHLAWIKARNEGRI